MTHAALLATLSSSTLRRLALRTRACAAVTVFAAAVLLGACATAVAPPPAELLPPGAQAVPLLNPSFEGDAQGTMPGWTAHEHNRGQSYTFVADTDGPHSGRTSARIRRHGEEFFGLLEQQVRVRPEWIGKRARVSGYLRTDGVSGTGGALVVQARDGSASILAHDHMDGRRATGRQGWKRYTAEVRIAPGTYALQVGAMLEDSGTLWVDDLSLAVLE